MKTLLSRCAGLVCLLLAGYFFVQVGQALASGQVTKLSKNRQEVIQRAAQPERFWIAVSFWSIGAGLLLVTGVKKIRGN